MRVLGFPYYPNSESGSARMRFWARLAAIAELIALKIFEISDDPGDFDVVYLQKKCDAVSIELCERAAKCGVPIVYDFDDAFGTFVSQELGVQMLARADAVVTDTRFKVDAYGKYSRSRMRVIPDGLDYYDNWFDITPKNEVRSACTFGWDINVEAATPYMLAARQNLDGPMSYISNKTQPAYEAAGVKFYKWQQADFLANLTAHDCAIICHGDSIHDRMRCTNRFLTAAFSGLLPIPRDSIEYAEIALHLGVPFLCARTPAHVPKIISEYGSRRAEIITALRPKIWQEFNPRVGGEKLYDVMRGVCRT
jgi:hypothetical protein